MICENCQKNKATVHLSSLRTVALDAGNRPAQDPFEHHYCESCAKELEQTNHLLNPYLRAGPSAKAMKVKVIGVSDTAIEVELTKEEFGARHDRCIFLRTLIPQDYAVEGMEFKMFVTEQELNQLQGK